MLAAVSIAAFSYYLHQQTIALYFDAKVHLHTAKEVVDGLTPGFAQLGGVWLPLYHLLTLPLIWVDTLFYSGLAGSMASMAAFVGASIFFLQLARLLLADTRAAYVALLAFALNPNLLYLQSIPMTESLYLLTFVASSYYLLRWVLHEDRWDLVWTAFWVCLATLTRYDGWGLALLVMLSILGVGIRRQYGYRRLEGLLLTFLPLAGFGIALWLLWNAVIFGQPLHFFSGEHSNSQSLASLYEAGYLPTKGNLLLCVGSFLYAALANHGSLIYGLFVLGLLLCLGQGLRQTPDKPTLKAGVDRNDTAARRISHRPLLWGLLLLLPIVYHVASLYLGHSALLVPQLSGVPMEAILNVRYGIVLLPAVALFAASLARGAHWRTWLVSGLIVLQYGWMVGTSDVATLKDARGGWSNGDARPVEQWLRHSYDSGLILTDAHANACRFIDTRVPLDRFLTQGNMSRWEQALAQPTQHAAWIWLRHDIQDKVWRAMQTQPDFSANYEQVFRDGDTFVYRRKAVFPQENT